MSAFLADFRRVGRREPCAVCRTHDHGCLIRTRDDRPACAKVPSGRPLGTAPPTWLHGDDGPDWRDALASPRAVGNSIMESPPEPPDPGLVGRGLDALLASCPPTDEHRAQLRRRGLSDDEIGALPLASLVAGGHDAAAAAIVAALGEAAYGAVPGLYRRAGRPALAGAPGLLVGVLQHGRLVGVTIRPDDPTGGKYVWLSSRGRPGGVGSGAPCGVLPGAGDRAIVIEGTLKALIVHAWTGRPVVSLPGVAITAAATGHLGEVGATSALLALDNDRLTNPHVAAAEATLIAALEAAGYPVMRLAWSPRFKGLDDALAGHDLPLPEPVSAPPPPDPERVAAAERRAAEAERRRLRLVRAIQAPGLAAAEKQSIVTLFTHLDAVRRDDPTLAEIAVPNAHVSEHVGVSDQTAGRHLAEGQRLVDAVTGEVVELYRRRTTRDPESKKSVTLYAPTMTLDDVLDFLPRAVPLAKDGTGRPKRGHGGPGTRCCPRHPAAPLVKETTVVYRCSVCRDEVDRDPPRGELVAPDAVAPSTAVGNSILEPGDDSADAALVPSDSSPPGVRVRASILESGQTCTLPLPGVGPPPGPDRWTDPANGRAGP